MRFMTARIVQIVLFRTIEMNKKNFVELLSTLINWEKDQFEREIFKE